MLDVSATPLIVIEPDVPSPASGVPVILNLLTAPETGMPAMIALGFSVFVTEIELPVPPNRTSAPRRSTMEPPLTMRSAPFLITSELPLLMASRSPAEFQTFVARETEKWAALGSAAVSVLGGLLGGRKGSGVSRTMGGLSKASSVLSKNRLEGAAEMRVESLREELAALEARLLEATEVDPERFEERPLVPRKRDVKLLRYDVVWIY